MSWARFQKALLEKAPEALVVHLILVLVTLVIAIAISLPAGVLLTRPRFKKYGVIVLNIMNLLQTIPGLAVIALVMPIVGLGYKPTIVALVFQSLLPIARNTIAGLAGVSPEVKEAAMGMGMSERKILFEVELPLAMPVILSGIKTSAVYVVSVATLGALIGAGGLGNLILGGLALLVPEYIIVGAGLGAIMAIAFERVLTYVEHRITPPGMRV